MTKKNRIGLTAVGKSVSLTIIVACAYLFVIKALSVTLYQYQALATILSAITAVAAISADAVGLCDIATKMEVQFAERNEEKA